MDCTNCGGPLPPKSAICTYCGTLNDTDLRAIHANTTKGPASDRVCPRCETNLDTIDLRVGDKFLIERCDKCLGMFFDPGEVQVLLDASVSHVYEIDFKRIHTLIEQEEIPNSWSVTYVKCPVCRKLMHRKSYGPRSGVIADTCKDHGVWLDGSELGKLLRWTKAGGQLHARNEAAREKRAEERRERLRRRADSERVRLDARYGVTPRTAGLEGLLGVVLRILGS